MTAANLRPELAQRLRRRLTAFGEGFRHNLALLGPPGSGKTFQLQQITQDPPANTLVIYCPLYRESCRSFLRRFLCAVLQAGLGSAAAEAEPRAQALEALLERAEARLPNTAAAVRAIEPLLTRRLYGEAFNRSLDTVPTLLAECECSGILILDEFLFLEELGLVHAFHELGKRVMTWHSTLFILSSSALYRARMILRERLQLLFGQFELLMLEAVEPAPAGVWVQQELRGVRGAKTMSPFLIQWLGAQPWYLAVFLRRLKELALLSKRPDFTESLFLQTAWDVIGSAEGTLHQWCASRLDGLSHSRSGTRAAEALIHVAQGARTSTELGGRIGRAGLPDALQALVEQDLAQRNGMCWMVLDPVLRCWLSTVFQAQRADAPLAGTDARSRFEHYLRSLWAHWVQAHQLSFSDQVVALFGKFRDETVSLDSKTGRLPIFQTIQARQPGVAGVETYLIADGPGRRWCATVQAEAADEHAITQFDAFCRAQSPKPSRKVVIMKSRMDDNARLLAKAASMWVWEADELQALMGLYGPA